jgi:hypothetical protein
MRYYYAFLMLLLAGSPSYAQRSNKKINVDTANATVWYDSSMIRLNYDNISDKDFWLDILSRDTAVFAYFREQSKSRSIDIYLSFRGMDKETPFDYIFCISYRIRGAVVPIQKFSADSLPIPQLHKRYDYDIILNPPDKNGKQTIKEVKFDGYEL